MISFASDYVAGCHPKILEKLAETNMYDLPGYGTDEYCLSAEKKIKAACGREDAEVHFLVGGTQANAVVIGTVLSDCECVISAKTGHINAHESGAVEFTGHKIIELGGEDGKLSVDETEKYLSDYYSDENNEHMTVPKMVYISFPTEYGTIYSKEELTRLYSVCRRYGVSLFIDGARLGYGLASPENDLTLPDIANLCDIFYIGGTKMGALCGEAVVFTHHNAPAHFRTLVKQRGAMIAKGRLLGVQFDALFTDGLYFEIGRYAIEMAERMKKIFVSKGYRFFLHSPTNQQFFIISKNKAAELREHFEFSFWENYDADNIVVRFATSWSTSENHLALLEKYL